MTSVIYVMGVCIVKTVTDASIALGVPIAQNVQHVMDATD
jgi:hypothetical protein